MDKSQVIDTFWNSFGLPAYYENSVPNDVKMPYITYELSLGSFETEISLTASIYYYSSSWKEISKKADEIAKRIYELRGSTIPFDNGRLRLYEGGVPMFQRMGTLVDSSASKPNSTEAAVKRILVTIMAEFMSAY